MAEHLIQYLPAIYQAAGEHSLLAHLLATFENILLGSGIGTAEQPSGLEEIIDDLARYFDPRRTPAEFLPWLAGWAALTLQADLGETRQREVIAHIIPLYAIRGTCRGVKEIVELFTGGEAEVREPPELEFQIWDHSTIGVDTRLGGPPPHVFSVRFRPPDDGAQEEQDRLRRVRSHVEIARAAIEMSKPAHTWFLMDVVHPAYEEGREGLENEYRER